MEIPELADLIWLFEDEPSPEFPELHWPTGLQSFRLRRGPREVLFSLDPVAGEAYITLYADGQELVSVGRLRRLETLRVIRRDDYEGLELRFVDARFDPVSLETKPGIRLSWDVMSLGAW